MTRPIILLGMLLVALGWFLPATAQAQPFVDDFGDGSIADGSPVSWVPYIDPWGQGGTAEVVNGDLQLTPSPTALAPPIPDAHPDYIEADVLADGRLFQDVSVHVVVNVSGEAQGWVFVAARDTWNNDPISMGVNVYAGVGVDWEGNPQVILSGSTGTGNMGEMRRTTLVNIHETDVHLQLDVIGRRASVFAWADGDDKPADPLLSRTITTRQMVAGQVGLGYGQVRPSVHPTHQLNTASFRFVEVVPEPSSSLLLTVSLLGLTARRRRAAR